MRQTIAIMGGSFNPAGEHHRRAAKACAKVFDKVVVVPCGGRPDKATTNDAEPIHRAVMCDLTFKGIPGARVDLFDLESDSFSPTWKLDERYASEGNVWHVVGADLVSRGPNGKSQIHGWERGEEIWRRLRFAILTRPGYVMSSGELPPHHRIITVHDDGSSTKIRQKIFDHEPSAHLVVPQVAAYIERYGLYTRMVPPDVARLRIAENRLKLVYDRANSKAAVWAERLKPFSVEANPSAIVVIGGDGMMLRAIRRHWRLRIPFLGIKTGNRGVLLNQVRSNASLERLLSQEFDAYLLPMLHVSCKMLRGAVRDTLAFNDAWMERATGQTAHIEVRIDGCVRLKDCWCDGMLVSTAQASYAYAQAMGASPLPPGTRLLVLAGSNVTQPRRWRPVYPTLGSVVQFHALDAEKRPVKGFADSMALGRVERMQIRASRIAGAEVLFLPQSNLAEKIAREQFGMS